MKRRACLLLVTSTLVLAVVASASPAQTIPFKVIRTVPHTNSYASGLAWHKDTLWIGYAFGSTLEQYDPYTSTRIKTLTAPNSKVRGLAHDGMDLWMASWYRPPSPSIFTIDTTSGKVVASFVAPFNTAASDGMGWDGTTLWIAEEANKIHQVDPVKWTIVRSLSVPRTGSYNPRGLAWDTRSKTVWAGYQSTGVIRKHNPLNGNVLAEFKSPYSWSQQGLAWDGWFLWATGGQQNNLRHMSQIDVTPPFMVMKGALKANTNIQFQMTMATGQANNLFVVGWSGSGTSGFKIGSKTIPLTFDAFTVLGLQLIAYFSMVIDTSGNATTPPFLWPAVPSGLPFWVCGVTLDKSGVVSVTEPIKYVTQ